MCWPRWAWTDDLAGASLRVSFGWTSTNGGCRCRGRIAAETAAARSHTRRRVRPSCHPPPWKPRTPSPTLGEKYKYGFVTDIEMERAPKGLSEDTVRYISAKKGEPDWMLEWRLGAFRRWLAMNEPNWARVHYPEDRLPERLLLRRAQEHAPETVAGRSRSQAAGDLQEAGHSAARADGAGRRGGGCGVRSAFRSPPPSRKSSTRRA